jgi:hypothetical protein
MIFILLCVCVCVCLCPGALTFRWDACVTNDVQAHWAKDRGDKAEQQTLQREIDKLDDQLAEMQEQYDAIGAVKKHI